MPIRVPVYEQQVQSSELPGFRQSGRPVAAQALSGVAQSVGQAGAGVGGAASDISTAVQKAQESRLRASWWEIDANLQAARQELLEHPETGFFQQKGKNAILEGKRYEDEWKRRVSKELEGIDEKSKGRLSPGITRLTEGFLQGVYRHTNTQQDAHEQSAFEASRQASVSSALSAAQRGDYDVMQDAIASAKGSIDLRAQSMGLSAEERDLAIKTMETSVYVGAIDTMLKEGRSLDAQEMLEAARSNDLLDEAMLSKSGVPERVAAAAMDRETTKQADTLIAKFSPEFNDELPGGQFEFDVASATRAAEETIENPGVRDEVLQKIDKHSQGVIQRRRANDSPRIARLDMGILQGGGINRNSDDWVQMSPEGQETVMSHLRAKRSEGRREQREIDTVLLNEFLVMSNTGFDEFSKVDLDSDPRFSAMSPGKRSLAKLHQARAINSAGVEQQEFNKLALDQANAAELNEKGRKAYIAKMAAKYAEWAAQPNNKNARPPKQLTDQWFAESMEDVETEGRLWGTNPRKRWEVGPDDKIVEAKGEASQPQAKAPQAGAIYAVDDIPPDKLQALTEVLRRKLKREPLGSELVDWYNAALRRQPVAQ